MDSREAEAKRLFLHYRGNTFQMNREGDYERYKAFGISKEREREWQKEESVRLLEAFKAEPVAGDSFHGLSLFISSGEDGVLLGLLIKTIREKAPHVDTFTLLRFAEELLSLYQGFRGLSARPGTAAYDARVLAKELLVMASERDFAVHDDYFKRSLGPDTLKRENIEARIRLGLEALTPKEQDRGKRKRGKKRA